jgi:Tol biopolymer transport system component
LIPAAGGEAVTLVEEDALNICPQWLGPRRLLYISDRHGPNDLYLLELDDSGKPTGPPVRLTTGLGAQSYTMSADKSVIAFSSFDKESNIWKLPIPTGDQPVINTGATPVTFGSQVIEGVGIARDGSALVFDSNRGGNQDIYKLQLPDGEQQQLTVDPASEFIPDFSPDGSEITFHSFATGNRDLFTMSSDGTEVTQVTTSTSEERFPKWSPDGNSLSFYSDRTGRPEVMITTRSARGEPWSDAVQVSHDGGGPSAWSPDGEWLAYGNSQGLMLVSVSGGEPSPIGTSGVEFKRDPYIQWSRDGQILYVKSWGSDGVAAIWEVSRESGEMRQLVRFDDPSMPTGRPEFALDDEFFYFTVAKQQNDIFTLDISARSGD